MVGMLLRTYDTPQYSVHRNLLQILFPNWCLSQGPRIYVLKSPAGPDKFGKHFGHREAWIRTRMGQAAGEAQRILFLGLRGNLQDHMG